MGATAGRKVTDYGSPQNPPGIEFDLYKMRRSADRLSKSGSNGICRAGNAMQTLGLSTIAAVCAAGLALTCAGCGEGDFNWGKVQHIIESNPVHIDAEYVMLSSDILECGVQEDLWDPPPPLKGLPGEHAFARLTDKARSLKFSDDVSIGDMRQPYAQVRGDFNLLSLDIKGDRDGPEKDTRLVEVKLGIKIDHTCFPNPLWVMGVHKGNFTQDYVPVLLFRYDNGWQLDRIMH